MNIEQAIERFKRIEGDLYIQNLIAQANARYILLNTKEDKANFPSYTIKDDRLNILAFYYLNLGCSIVENHDFEGGRISLEKAALILEYVHGSDSNRVETSNYFGLISALAYYIAFQYSKSFILIQKFEHNTILARLLSFFLKRDFRKLTEEINKIVIDETYQDEFIAAHTDEIDGDTKIYELVIAKSLNGFIQYFYSGNEDYLNEAKTNLLNLKEIAEIKKDPGIWWVIRLLLLITDSFKEAALWNVLRNYFDINSPEVKRYILSLVHLHPRGIYELFVTQRKSLPKVLDSQNKGSIISIPTSSGKTRIAEIAIFNCLNEDRNSKVLYIAPFRSLAFEIENSLDKILQNSQISVSQLYGGGLFSKLDEKIIEESDAIIATPEKAKAMLRANAEILDDIKLVVIDEGHLFGGEKRLVVNEIFYEELKYFVEKNHGKFLLLSAVLPNADVLAAWLTESTETVYKDTWRPSDERFGTLEWTGSAVNLNWRNNDSERATFNSGFVKSEEQPLRPRERVTKFLPGDKNEAVAATAIKLQTFGTVLIFVGRKASVFVMARAYLKCLGIDTEDFTWRNTDDWKAYELACKETYGDNNDWLQYASKGILCHHGELHSDVRLPLERLMRNDKPRVIIATSTLGQGVNLGISTVIFSTLDQGGKELSKRDFWNIAGRAGRAFVDYEGKVLIALDITKNNTRAERIEIRNTRQRIDNYFDKNQISGPKSGILLLLLALKRLAFDKGISFDLLIQLIAENRTEELGDSSDAVEECLDWIDDSLLALQDIHSGTEETIDFAWIEDFFRKSLAYIQAASETEITGEEIIQLIKSRIQGIIVKVGIDKTKWQSIITSGIPLQSSLFIDEHLTEISNNIEDFISTEKTIDDKIRLLKSIEIIIKDIPVFKQERIQIDPDELDDIRNIWLSGGTLSLLLEQSKTIKIISNYYSYLLPWLLNAIAKKLNNIEETEKATILEELSILTELGIPNIISVKIYQTGIRSRSASQNISTLFNADNWDTKTIKEFKTELIHNKERYKSLVSNTAAEWIELLSNLTGYRIFQVYAIPPFNIDDDQILSETLIAREINGTQYLVSPDLNYIKDMSESNINFSSINNVNGIHFKFKSDENVWKMKVENPYIIVR